MKMQLITAFATALSFASLAFPGSTFGAEHRLIEHVERSASTLKALASRTDGIPRQLLKHATCVTTLRLYKAGAIIGIKKGRGVTSCRTGSGTWSAPLFTEINGISAGVQVGLARNDVVLVFVRPDAADLVAQGRVRMGVDAAVVAGPKGINTDVEINRSAYAYTASEGVFVGLSLDGTYLDQKQSENIEAYGRSTSAGEILKKDTTPENLATYGQVLSQLTAD